MGIGIVSWDSASNKRVINYRELGNKIFKLLPIYEGKIKNSEEKVPQEIAYSNFKKNLEVLCQEIKGIIQDIEVSNNLLEVSLILEGLRATTEYTHDTVKSAVLHSMNLIKDF